MKKSKLVSRLRKFLSGNSSHVGKNVIYCMHVKVNDELNEYSNKSKYFLEMEFNSLKFRNIIEI